MTKITNLTWSVALVLASSVCAFGDQSLGEIEYQRSCAQCHGGEGMGNGYLAELLVIAPPDLTSIKKRNDGVFPVSDIYQLIVNGTWYGRVHGTREMPVWGPRYSLEAKRNLGTALSVIAEREVHEKVAALVDYVHRLQRPSPESIDAAFAIIENDILEIMRIKPRDLELVVTVPHGFRAVAAETILLWIRDGTFMPGSGKYEMQRIAIRDVVGGQSQTTFVFSEQHAEVTSRILGNSELIAELEAASLSTDDTYGEPNDIEYSFAFQVCEEGLEDADGNGFSGIHLRDRSTNALYYEFGLQVPIQQFATSLC